MKPVAVKNDVCTPNTAQKFPVDCILFYPSPPTSPCTPKTTDLLSVNLTSIFYNFIGIYIFMDSIPLQNVCVPSIKFLC